MRIDADLSTDHIDGVYPGGHPYAFHPREMEAQRCPFCDDAEPVVHCVKYGRAEFLCEACAEQPEE